MEICFLGQNLFEEIFTKMTIYSNKILFNHSFIFPLEGFQ